MKKNFVKKLAVALSLAMGVSALAPAASADAAATPAFKTYRTSVYENGTNKGSYTYTVKNIKKGYTVKWSVTGDAKDYVKVSKTSTKATKTTVNNTVKVATNGKLAAKNGKATVTAKVYNTKNKLVKTIKDAVTVKVQATGVVIKAADGSDFVTAVGEKYDLNRTLTPANSTSKTYWSVDSEDVTIDSQGVMTATKAGEYTVTATVRNAKDSKVLTTATQKVVVKESVLKSVAQSKANELSAVFAGDTSKIVNTDIVITRSDNVVVPVSKVTVDKTDKTKVTLTTFSDMTDGKDYTVKYSETVLTFKATDGKVTSVVIDPITIPYNTETEINVIGKDANGVEVFEVNKTEASAKKVDLTIETTQGYMTDNNLVLLEKGNTAKATATLHTYTYNDDGTEKNVLKTEAIITAVDPEVVSISGSKYTVAKVYDEKKPVNTKLSVDDKGYSLFFELRNAKDKVITKDYTKVESSDTNILLVGDLTSGDLSKVELKPVKEGTAYVLVKDSKDNVIASFAVTVVAERKPTSLVFDKNSVTLSNSVVGSSDEVTVKVTVKDQYGEDMSPAKEVSAKVENSPSSDATAPTADTSVNGKVKFTANSSTTKGSYVFKITFGELKRMINVTVNTVAVDSKAPYTYKLDLGTTKVDTTVNASDTDLESIVIQPVVYEYQENVKVGNAKITEVELFDSKGAKVTTGAAVEVIDSGKQIQVTTVSGSSITKNLDAGSYTVKVTFTAKDNAHKGKEVKSTATAGFVVEDNQTEIKYTVKKNKVPENNIYDAVNNNVEFSYNGDTNAVTVQSVNAEVVQGNENAKIKVKVSVQVGRYSVNTEVTLNQTITINQ